MELKEKEKITFTNDWDIYPHDTIKKGETGSIKFVGSSIIVVALDATHESLSEWDNEIYIDKNSDDERKIEDYIKIEE